MLTFGVLTLLALPVESHDTDNNGTRLQNHALPSIEATIRHPGHPHNNSISSFFGGEWTAIHPKHFEIQWIRIYKNPKTTSLAQLKETNAVIGRFMKDSIHANHVITPEGFETRPARLYRSLHDVNHAASDADFWVNIDPGTGPSDSMSGGLLEDENKPGNSGLVTGSKNQTVVAGDIVAIAINVKLTYYKAVKEPTDNMGLFTRNEPRKDPYALGLGLPFYDPRLGKVWAPQPDEVWARNFDSTPNQEYLDRIAGGSIVAAVGIDPVGILNPNYPLERLADPTDNMGTMDYVWDGADRAVTHTEWGHPGKNGYHTLVYQFKVTKDHVSLNNGDWFDGDGTVVNPFNVLYNNPDYGYATFNTSYGLKYSDLLEVHEAHAGFLVPFGVTHPKIGTKWGDFINPSALLTDAPHPFTTFRHHAEPQNPALRGTFRFERTTFDRNGDNILDYIPVIDTLQPNGPVFHYAVRNQFYVDRQHKFPHYRPPTYDTVKGRIHYPKVVERVGATPKLDPTETQTGTFTVTLRFQEDYGDVGQFPVTHDPSEEVLATLQAALVAGVEHGTVTLLERLAAAGTYQVTLVPELGFEGGLTLHVPEDTVFALLGALGNLAATLTVPIDTTLPALVVGAPEIVAPEAAVYTSGDKLTVEVPFAETGLTFEGEHPPYVRIYLGRQQIDENARDAIWQQGEERSGSTIVPFVYILQEADVSVLQALEPAARKVLPDVSRLGIPAGTRVVAREAGRARRGSDRAPVGAGVVAPPLSDAGDGGLSLQDASGREPAPVTADVPVPVLYLPPAALESKAVASPVPRSPIVFNELGNGSEAANDWLEFRNVSGSDVSLKDWELSVVADGKKEDTSLIVFPDVSVPANGLLLITNSAADKTPLAGGENRGLSHASLVDAGLSLPDDGKFLLILRNAKEKLGLDEAFIDVAGGGGSDTDAFIRDETGDYDTYVWPLQVLEAPGDATEDALSSGKVWQRAKADIIGYHQAAWAEAAFTGIGYDRKVTRSAATAGTPGYPNGAAKTAASTPKGAVTISEIMFDSDRGKLPQWIELYNKSKTEALNLDRWQLEIQNRNSEDLIGRPIVTLTLQEKVIQPNQTLLIVAGDARASSADVFPADRVYNLLELHEKNLRIKTPRDTFLSGEGFYLKLSDRNGTKIDEVGNIDDNRRTDDAPVWVWPTNRREGPRSSVVRRYEDGTSQARDGMLKENWALAAYFNRFKVESLHYGHTDDIGTPGYRKGGALPVELSSFKVTRTDEGPVIVTWTTESEVDNAGFNLRRSLTRDSGFTLLNPVLIAGAGTTGERQTYTFTDTSAKPGVEYYYQIEEVSLGGRPETLRTRRLPGPVSPANRALTTFGEVKQRE